VSLVLRTGETSSFITLSYEEAQRMIAMLPPVSAPVRALAA